MTDNNIYTLPLGPQHPALVEPEYLKIYLEGETIRDVDINLGFMHRGIEKALQQRTYMHGLFLAERVCGICSSVHTVAFCSITEKLMNLKIPERAKYIRMIIAELERIHSHLLWVGIAGYEIGLDTVFQLVWRDREHAMGLLEKISGNRVNYAMNTIGGVRRDIPQDTLKEMPQVMDIIDSRIHHYIDIFINDSIITKRTRGTGILTKKDAIRYCATGPTARASDISCDIRKKAPYLVYDKISFSEIRNNKCDVEAKVVVRLKELLESTKIIRQCIKDMPKGDLAVKAPAAPPKDTEAVFRAEAPRGELLYYAKSDGTERPERMKINTPTLANLSSVKPMLIGQQLADLPIIVASIDTCFCCTERITLIDTRDGKTKTVDEAYLKSLEKR